MHNFDEQTALDFILTLAKNRLIKIVLVRSGNKQIKGY
jgi:hypothetical protein